MRQEFENGAQDVQTVQQYEAPAMEVVEMEIEGPILGGSGGFGGEDSPSKPW